LNIRKKIPKASAYVGQFIHVFAHPQTCLSLVQVIDFDCHMLKQKMRQSIKQDSGDALEPEDVENPTILQPHISTNAKIDKVLSILENRQRVGQSNHSKPANVLNQTTTGDRQIETLPPTTAAQPATPPVKNLVPSPTSPLPPKTTVTNPTAKGSGLTGKCIHTLKIWHVDTGKLLSTLVGHSSFVYSVAFSPEGKTLASGSADKSIKIWQVSNGELLRTLISYAPVNSVAFSPDRQFLVSAGGDERIKLWQLNTSHLGPDTRPAPTQTLTGQTGEIFSLAFSPRSPILASSSYDKTINLWNFQTGNLLSTLTGHLHSVRSLAFSANGMTLVSASHDKTIKLWQIIPETKKS